MSTRDIGARVDALDETVFDHVMTNTRVDDRRSLLALHAACRQVHGAFAYLEIGSHLGGSLQALVADPACRAIVSVDPRPDVVPDERGRPSVYAENTTESMLARLAAIPGADISKIVPLEASTEDLDAAVAVADTPPVLAFIDGEHTDAAALRDARYCLATMGGVGCVAFHDPEIVYRAIDRFIRELQAAGTSVHPYLLPYSVFVVEVGEPQLRETAVVQQRLRENWRGYLFGMLENDRYRLLARSRIVRLLHRFGRIDF